MLELGLLAFTTLFATISPIDTAVVFVTLTPRMSRPERRAIALRATGIATTIMLVFAVLGQPLLAQLGVSLAALKAAGGIILLIIAIDMIFARDSGALGITRPESVETEKKTAAHAEIAVFPLATPLLAGPGAMSGAVLLAAKAGGDPLLHAAVLTALLVVMGITLFILLIAQEIHDFLGITAQKVIIRVFGILLAAMAMQSLFDGIAESGVFRPR